MNQDIFMIQQLTPEITTITLNRPDKHNAIDDRLIKNLTNTLQLINNKETIRVVILKANGHHFCAGADLHWMERTGQLSHAASKADALSLVTLLQCMTTLRQPIIALVHGRVIGGGIGLLACCDLVLAADDSHFCFAEVKLGLIPATIAPYILRTIGFSATRRYFLSAESFTAPTAHQLGLVHQCVPADKLSAHGKQLAHTLLNHGPHAMAATKQLLQRLAPLDANLIDASAELLATIRATSEAQQGMQAFLHKQRAPWIK